MRFTRSTLTVVMPGALATAVADPTTPEQHLDLGQELVKVDQETARLNRAGGPAHRGGMAIGVMSSGGAS